MSFTHSEKLSTQYRRAVFIVKKVILEKASCKQLIRDEKHAVSISPTFFTTLDSLLIFY